MEYNFQKLFVSYIQQNKERNQAPIENKNPRHRGHVHLEQGGFTGNK